MCIPSSTVGLMVSPPVNYHGPQYLQLTCVCVCVSHVTCHILCSVCVCDRRQTHRATHNVLSVDLSECVCVCQCVCVCVCVTYCVVCACATDDSATHNQTLLTQHRACRMAAWAIAMAPSLSPISIPIPIPNPHPIWISMTPSPSPFRALTHQVIRVKTQNDATMVHDFMVITHKSFMFIGRWCPAGGPVPCQQPQRASCNSKPKPRLTSDHPGFRVMIDYRGQTPLGVN